MVVGRIISGLIVVWASMAHAQDMCGGALPYQADPKSVTDFRQQCTIQKLLAARTEEATRRTAAEVEAAVEAAHNKALSGSITKANEEAEYWKSYAAGLESMIPKIDAVCAWRGTKNEPTATLCKATGKR